MSNTGTVPEQKTSDGTVEASTNQVDVSTQELVDSMVDLNASLGEPWKNPPKTDTVTFK